MEELENNSKPKVKDLILFYEKQGRFSSPKSVRSDLAYMANNPINDKSIQVLAVYFNSSEKEIRKDVFSLSKETVRNQSSSPISQLNSLSTNDKKDKNISQDREAYSREEINFRLKQIFGKDTHHRAEEIPFRDFKTHFGMNEKQVLEKGKGFLGSLLNGSRTEMESFKFTSASDMEVSGRLSMKDSKLFIHPLQPDLKTNTLSVKNYEPIKLTNSELDKIKAGNAIPKDVVKKDGTREALFIQKDQKNNEILSIQQKELRSPDTVVNKTLSAEQREKISQGKEVIIQGKDTGNLKLKIDLTSNKGFSVYNERGIKENRAIDFFKKDSSLSNIQDRDRSFSRENRPEREHTYIPQNQRSQGSRSR